VLPVIMVVVALHFEVHFPGKGSQGSYNNTCRQPPLAPLLPLWDKHVSSKFIILWSWSLRMMTSPRLSRRANPSSTKSFPQFSNYIFIFISGPLNPMVLNIINLGGFHIRSSIPNNVVIELIWTPSLNPHGCVDLHR
jgi:hypothetical protein